MGIYGMAGGALAGAALGYMNTGTGTGAVTGAAFGAGVGGFGRSVAGAAAGNRTIAGIARRSMGFGAHSVRKAEMFGARIAANPESRLITAKAGNMLATGARRFQAGLGTAQRFIGENAIATNKWGGHALMGLGVSSAALMGSSVLKSNKGFDLALRR